MSVYHARRDHERRLHLFEEGGRWIALEYRYPGQLIRYVGAPDGRTVWSDYATEGQAHRDASGWMGQLDPLPDLSGPLDGWPGLPPPYVAPEDSVPIRPGQIWRRGHRKAVVEWYARSNVGQCEMRVGTRYTSSTPNPRGRMDRRPAVGDYSERRFREVFRFVREG